MWPGQAQAGAPCRWSVGMVQYFVQLVFTERLRGARRCSRGCGGEWKMLNFCPSGGATGSGDGSNGGSSSEGDVGPGEQ